MAAPQNLLRAHHRLAGLRLTLAFARLRLGIKAGFKEDQPRNEIGRWTDDINGGVARPLKRRTGNSKIDRKTDELIEIVTDVANGVKNSKGALFGIAVHFGSAETIRQLDLPGIGKHGVEQSFSLGETVRYGLAGSIRTDIILRDGRSPSAPIIAVWDIKTGSARLSTARVRQIRSELKIDDAVPVIELHVNRGIRIKSIDYIRNLSISHVEIGDIHVARRLRTI